MKSLCCMEFVYIEEFYCDYSRCSGLDYSVFCDGA